MTATMPAREHTGCHRVTAERQPVRMPKERMMPRTTLPAGRLRDSAALALVALALAACSGPSPGASAPPSPSASPSPSATPTPTETTAPPTPSASARPSVTPSAEPEPEPEPAAASCGDEFILDRPHLVWWEGTEAEQLAAADAQPVFEPPAVLEGLDVICVSTFSNPLDDPAGGVVRIAEALVERDDAAFDRLEAWAAANGYAAVSEGPGYLQYAPPADADGSQRSLFWAPLDSTQPSLGNAETIMRYTGADADDIYVTHSVTMPD
ncbi:hypothetical protein [Agrococcus sp. TF02-05]|uniref:hypothetical protein n=1 Tax=Agrococcus sp. TF02-05 TaxID=2815211 RepID=UPI001AA0BA4F|nr:hypothetical protein [Agrococcus sp. TF02-05]MBO1769463.1 hypothetical protein [Agrococcus sp. TF02-05]